MTQEIRKKEIDQYYEFISGIKVPMTKDEALICLAGVEASEYFAGLIEEIAETCDKYYYSYLGQEDSLIAIEANSINDRVQTLVANEIELEEEDIFNAKRGVKNLLEEGYELTPKEKRRIAELGNDLLKIKIESFSELVAN